MKYKMERVEFWVGSEYIDSRNLKKKTTHNHSYVRITTSINKDSLLVNNDAGLCNNGISVEQTSRVYV